MKVNLFLNVYCQKKKCVLPPDIILSFSVKPTQQSQMLF